ncbi:Apolipoprotein A-I [Anabarilius grahami]|uniref:Apolipoprotein A-I n=1 Tax=Anabarilius grahami TaxID=495550 RepID=A0A3N0YNS3_ANAGA|nr:Apolipoprotein A-I [Anabarilius grahami]
MQVFLVIALLLCTGCQANLFYADEPKTQLEKLTDACKSYVDQATRTAEETVKKIRTSQLGEDINQYTTNLKEQMDPLAKDLMTKITNGADMLRERIEVEVSTVRCALKPYIEYVTSPFQRGADYIRDLNFEDLKATLLQKSEELRESLKQSIKELQAKQDPST